MQKFRGFTFLFAWVFCLATWVGCQKSGITPPDEATIENHPEQYGNPFGAIPATPDIILYEINQRAFSVQGTLAGILPRLDSIKALGVNVIWLMPIHPIGKINSVNSPYSVQNYKEVNPEFGNLEDLRTLVKESHARGMAVILDWVANHTSWDNPWIDNKNWYTQDASGKIIHPAGTNWMDVADLNFENAAMRQEMIKAMKYWVLHANVDGYRCDAADWIPFSFWKEAIDSLRAIPNRKIIMLAEGSRKDHFSAGFDFNFSWDYFDKLKNVFKNNHAASDLITTHQTEYTGLGNNFRKLRFTSNHDECAWDDTPLGLFNGIKGSMAALVTTVFSGCVPLIYNGQEVGCPVKLPFFSKSPINWATNPGMFKEYQKILNIRANHPAAKGVNANLTFSNSNMLGLYRESGNHKIFTLVNCSKNPAKIQIPDQLSILPWKNAITGQSFTMDSIVSLAGYEFLILVNP